MALTVGARAPFTYNDLYYAPIGTTVEVNRTTYTKEYDGFWAGPRTFQTAQDFAYDSRYLVTHVPETPFVETLEQFKHRLWTMTMGTGRVHGIEEHRLVEALRGVDAIYDFTFRPEMFVHLNHRDLVNVVPEGTVLLLGDHRAADRSAILVRRGGDTHAVMGGRRMTEQSLARVVSYPEGTPVLPWAEPQEDEAERINEYRHTLWDLGLRYKSQFSWCGQHERTLSMMFVGPGIPATLTPTSATETGDVPAVGSTVRIEDTFRAPVGSQFAQRDGQTGQPWTKVAEDDWRPPTHQTGWTHGPITAFTMGNTKVWVRWGPEAPAQSDTPVSAPASDVPPLNQVGIVSHQDMRRAPVGSQIAQVTSSWEKDGPDHWSPLGTTGIIGPSEDFAVASLRWTRWGPDVSDVPPLDQAGVVTRRDMVRAPVGSRIDQPPSMSWEKDDTDHWRPTGGGGLTGESALFTTESLRWVRWGDGSVAEPAPVAEQPEESEPWRSYDYGQDLTPVQRMALPAGSMVGYSNLASADQWNYCMRVVDGTYDTAYVAGPNHGMHIGGTMSRFLCGPDGVLRVESANQLAQMPEGTVIVAGTLDVFRVKQSDGRWRYIGSQTRHGQLTDCHDLVIDGREPRARFVYIPAMSAQSRMYRSWGTPPVLERITTREDFDRLPIGTKIQSNQSERIYTKQAQPNGDAHGWSADDGSFENFRPDADGRMSVYFPQDHETIDPF